MRPVDRDSSEHVYQQIANSMREAIEAPEFPLGGKLPGNSKLATYFGVAQMTVRRATEVLLAEGVVIARQGEGTFRRKGIYEPRMVRVPASRMKAMRDELETLRAELAKARGLVQFYQLREQHGG